MEPTQKTNGALVGSIIIIVILIIGGIYFWKTSLKERALPNNEVQNSDASADMETDVNSIDLDSLDSDL